MIKLFFILLLILSIGEPGLQAVHQNKIQAVIENSQLPFSYDLRLTLLPNSNKEADVLVTMHGIGGDYRIAELLHRNPAISHHIVSFNFPHYDLRTSDWSKTLLGTIDEILPALSVWKLMVIEGHAERLHLYGFSAGGGAIVNALALLNSNLYDERLQEVGIGSQEKRQILEAIEKGSVILEVPLKSFDEVAENFHAPDIYLLAKRAHKNNLVPIANLALLKGLKLNIFVYFAPRDEILGNRDDKKFMTLLLSANSEGKTYPIIGPAEGHNRFHPKLWSTYKSYLGERE